MFTSIGEELSVVCTVAAAYESLLLSLRGANAGIHFLASPLDVRSRTLVLTTIIHKRDATNIDLARPAITQCPRRRRDVRRHLKRTAKITARPAGENAE